jgi:hypothetical protein
MDEAILYYILIHVSAASHGDLKGVFRSQTNKSESRFEPEVMNIQLYIWSEPAAVWHVHVMHVPCTAHASLKKKHEEVWPYQKISPQPRPLAILQCRHRNFQEETRYWHVLAQILREIPFNGDQTLPCSPL